MSGIYYAAVADVWEAVDKVGVVELLASQRERIAELEALVAFREFERDQAYAVLRAREKRP